MKLSKHEYLADGVYAELKDDELILRTGDHRDEYCDNKIYLDDDVINLLLNFLEENREWTTCKKS